MQNRKARKEKESIGMPWNDLSSFSVADLQAALECQMAWGVTDIFDSVPGLPADKYETREVGASPFSFLSSLSVAGGEEKRISVIRDLPKNKSLSQKSHAVLEAPSPSYTGLSRAPLSQISISTLRTKLQEANTIEDALACARSFGGAGLAQTALRDIKGTAAEGNDGFLVTSEISQEVERAGKILVGEEGLLIKRLFASVGLSLEDFSSAPALPWRPPGGRDPLPEEIETCVPLLLRIIALSAPKWIVTFGGLSARMLLEDSQQGKEKESVKDRFLRPPFHLPSVRGRWHEVSFAGMNKKIHIFPFMAPSRLKNSARMRQSMWRDLQAFKQGLEDILKREK